jgi:hypothetical protein
MGKTRKRAIVVFLIIFTLIKISPIYYKYQFFPPSGAQNSGVSKPAVNKAHPSFLVSVEKSIVDKNIYGAVPEINFSGVPFNRFFLGICFLALISGILTTLSLYSGYNKPIYLLQSVFRL